MKYCQFTDIRICSRKRWHDIKKVKLYSTIRRGVSFYYPEPFIM